MIRPISRLAAGAAVSVAMLVGVPGTALAGGPSMTMQVQSQAQLLPDGSAVLTVDYSCMPDVAGPGGVIIGELEQTGAVGGSFSGAICDDQKHQVTLDQAPGPFTRGPAAAFVSVQNSNGEATAQTEVLVQ
ncbi:MAG: hypothetical protein E6G56_07820 [Actinobacteria bacterium]|nr:MAG: hypothetical protein E6G56_07820 [Actinomycetota bacterium]